jgi:hexokinase
VNNKHIIEEFLKKYGMNPDTIDIDKECGRFIAEMDKGLQEEASLKMLPSYISGQGEVPVNERVIVMDAGGTNFRVASVYFNEKNEAVIEDFAQYPMPGSQGEITSDEFYDTVSEYLRPVMDKSSKIGFCFSYASEALPDMDGRLIQFSKEIKVTGLPGQVIGKGLLQRIKEKGMDSNKSVVILNDTVATLLAGKAACMGKAYGGYIGYILGTGTNTCYSEDYIRIKKVRGLKPGSMLINMESGGYNKATRGAIDEEMDNKTLNPGQYAFEKMISGQYLGAVIHTAVLKAVKDKLFNSTTIDKLLSLDEIVTIDGDEFMRTPYGNGKLASCFSKEDIDGRERLYYIIDGVLERAARLVAVNLISIIMKTDMGRSPLRPVCIATEGSTFYKLKSYRDRIEYYMKKHLVDEQGRYYEIVKVENSSLIGAAIGGLLS